MWKLVFPEARRGLQYKNEGKHKPADIEGTPFRIECKKQCIYPSILDALKQAYRDGSPTNDPRPPLAVTAKDYTRPLVSMFEDDFLRLMEKCFNKGDWE